MFKKKYIYYFTFVLAFILILTGCSRQSADQNTQPIRMGTSVDFLEREDGIPGMEEKYGFKFDRDALKTMQIGLTYQAVESDKLDVAMGYATDGRISSMDLAVLEDDKAYFPVYNPAPVVREEIVEAYAQLPELMAELSSLFSQEKLIELNKRADIDGQEPEKIAEDFLNDNNLLIENAEEKSGPAVVVASKPWTEQLILGNITLKLLENRGYNVEDRNSLGSTAVLRNAVESDQIDLYWEYTGTTLMTTMGSSEVITDPEKAYNRVKEWDKDNGIIWLDYAEANNTYSLIMKKEKAEDLNLKTISDLADYVNNQQ